MSVGRIYSKGGKNEGTPGRVTDYVFGSLIDAMPSDANTVLTTLSFMDKL